MSEMDEGEAVARKLSGIVEGVITYFAYGTHLTEGPSIHATREGAEKEILERMVDAVYAAPWDREKTRRVEQRLRDAFKKGFTDACGEWSSVRMGLPVPYEETPWFEVKEIVIRR